MARITTIDLAEARNRLKGRAPGSDARAPYREAIANLSGNRMLELDLDDGETMRGLKLNVNRAAKEINRPVGYGESDSGTLLVWLQDRPKQTRGPRKRRQVPTTEA
jgi:hypothetical protein